MFAHGAQKLFGWFGGFGFEGTMQFFTQTIGLPYAAGLTIILLETAGMLFLAAGLFTRYLSAGVIIIMLGAIFTVHLPNGFFMNWHGNLQGEGFEMHILLISLAFINTMYEGGALSLQDWASKKLRKAHINDGMFFI
jgi:putative oxidoreductase